MDYWAGRLAGGSKLAAVPEDTSIMISFDINTLPSFPPQGFVKRSTIELVVATQYRFDGCGGLQSMVMRHSGEEMMGYMGVGDVVEHLVQHAVVTIHGGQSSPQPVPVRGIVVRECWMSVLQVCDDDQECVHHQQRHPVHAYEPRQAFGHHQAIQHVTHAQHSHIREVDLEALPVGVYGAVRIEVAGEAAIGAAGQVEGQVQGPAEGESDGKCEDSACRVVAQVLGEPGEFGFGLGDEHLVAVERAGVGVVAAVADLPREVGD